MSNDGAASDFFEFMGSVKNSLAEKVDNPLFLPFLLSWLGWNYRFLLVVFSDEGISEKFQLIAGLYSWSFEIGKFCVNIPLYMGKVFWWLVIPLLCAGAFIRWFPRYSSWALDQWLAWLVVRNDAVLKSSRKQLMSKERSKAIVQENANLKKEVEEKSSYADTLLEELTEKDVELESLRTTLRSNRVSVSDDKESGCVLTIADAAKLVLANSYGPLTVTDIYDGIVIRKLYTFGAENPQHVVRTTLVRASVEYEKRLEDNERPGKRAWFIRYPDGRFGLNVLGASLE